MILEVLWAYKKDMGLISDRSKSIWKEKFLPWEILTFEMVFSLNLREKKVIFKKMKIETE